MNTFDVHTHVDPDVLHQGCDACINRVRADQRAALIEAAPRRRVTWHATYQLEVEGDHLEIRFTSETGVLVIDLLAGRLLPNIEIGPIVPDGPVGPTPVLPSLFESTAL